MILQPSATVTSRITNPQTDKYFLTLEVVMKVRIQTVVQQYQHFGLTNCLQLEDGGSIFLRNADAQLLDNTLSNQTTKM
jgi:hypothetical protein